MAANNQSQPSVPIKTEDKLRTFTSSVWFSALKELPLNVFAVGVIYAAGYWGYSPIWLIAAWGLFQYRNEKRRERNFKLYVHKAIAVKDERKLVIANVDPLPSWVIFTDIEQCECVNKIIAQLWPSFQPYLLENLKKIEPIVNDVMSKYKSNPNFCFKKASLGALTPRVSGVQVHNNNTGHFDRTIADIYIFFVSDVEFHCSVMHSINFGLKQFQIQGCLRTIVTTSESTPIPGVEFFFINQPSLDFNLTGLLNVGDLPGLSGIVRNTVDSVIAKKLVLPNKLIINYHDSIDFNKLIFPDPQGLLSVNVTKAKFLSGVRRFAFSGSKLPDPYLTVTMGTKTFTSPSVTGTTDPVWNFSVDFIVDSFLNDTITISVLDDIDIQTQFHDPYDIDDDTTSVPAHRKEIQSLGNLSLSLKLVDGAMNFHSWIPLEDVVTGMINVAISYHKLENKPELLASNDVPAILEVLIDDAKDLTKVIDKVFAEVSVGDVKRSSRHVSIRHQTGVFREVFAFPVKNPKTDKLQIKLINEDDNKDIGNTEFDIRQLLEAHNMEVMNEQSNLRGPNDSSRLSVSMRLRTLKH